MRHQAKPVVVALLSVLFLLAFTTSCGDFFPSSNAIVSISISPTNGLVKPGATTQFTATGTLGNNQTKDVTSQVTWSSSAAGIATIDATGLATGVATGTATIQAKSEDAVATATLLVSNITAITISSNNASTTIATGGTVQLTAKDQSGNDISSQVTWNSDNTSIATVSAAGLVTGQSLGTAGITATVGNLTSNSITITVD